MGKKLNSKRMKIDGRTYRTTLDKFLADRQLKRKQIAKDGSCLFRAVSEQVYDSQCYHYTVRLKCVEYIDAHQDDFKEFITVSLDKYLALLSKELWGGEVELVVLSRLYNRSIVVYNELRDLREVQEQVFLSIEDAARGTIDRLTNPILLAYSDNNHYDGVFSRQYMEDTAFCQGLLYTMLIEKVFKQHVTFPCKRKLSNLQESDINSVVKYGSGQERDGGRVFTALSRFGVDVLRAMSWTMHHNAALSLHRWEKDGVEQRDRHMAASIQFHVGNRCHFYIDGKRMNGEIAALNVKSGIHLVRVQKERWEIPVKDLTLFSSQSTPKQGRPGEPLVRSNSRTPGDKDSRSRQHKDRPSPATTEASSSSPAQSILGPPPTGSSVPSGSVRRGKTTPQSREHDQAERREHGQTERAQKNNYGKHRSGSAAGRGTPAETGPQQQEHSRTKPNPSRTDHVRSSANEGLPVSATLSSTIPSPNPAKTPYSSVVKKTAGGPSGSLTSEGTEYDESSGDEEPQDENKEEVSPQESSKFPAPRSQQRHQRVEERKSRDSMGQDSNTAETNAMGKPAGAKLTAGFIQASSSSNVAGTESFVIPSDDSPYLDPQIPQGVPSQPQDAWPEMPQAIVPPHNTMIYAAVMTNRSNQEQQESPIVSSSTLTAFPYSVAKTHYSGPLHVASSRVANPSVTYSPQTATAGLCLPQTLPHSSSVSDHTGLGLNSAELGYNLPAGRQHSPIHAHPQFQSSKLPTAATSLSYGVVDRGNRASGEVYNSSSTRASSRPQVPDYNTNRSPSSRSPRMNEETTTNPLQGAVGTSFPYHAISTVAAGMEMRSMLGIEGAVRPLYTGSSGFQTTMSTGQRGPVTRESCVQTEPPDCSTKEVQAEPEQITQGVQTSKLSSISSETQTLGSFVPAEELLPTQDIQGESMSIAVQLSFAVKYSLQCLQALSQATGDDHQAEAVLQELLDNNHVEQLVEQAAQTSRLTAPQLNFLRSIGSPGDVSPQLGDGQSQSAEFSRNEDVTPQQEHHMPSPGVPPLNMPHGYPFMFPPFMMPPPPQRMYHPLMPHMPIHPLPMGYAPMVPPPMLQHQMPMPPVSPGTVMRVEEEGGEDASYTIPNDAHQHDLPVQGIEHDVAEVDSGPPQQIQPVQSSDVLEPFPTPAQRAVPTAVPPHPDAVVVPSSNQFEGTNIQQQPDTQSSKRSELALPTADKRESVNTPIKTTTEAAVPKAASPLPVPQAAPSPLVRNQKGSRRSQPGAHNAPEHPPTGETNKPGLPNRPSSNQGGSKYQQHSRRQGRSKGQGSGGEGQRKAVGGVRAVGSSSSRKLDMDEKNSFSERGKKELGPSSKKNFRSSTNKHSGHATAPVANSGNKPSQDPTRNFADRTRKCSGSSTCLDTKGFQWDVHSPSPGEVVLDSPPANTSGDCKPESEVTEWPDLVELGVSSKQEQTFSASLKFKVPDVPYEASDTFVFPDDSAPAAGIWEEELHPLTVSPSQNFCLGQPTGRHHKH